MIDELKRQVEKRDIALSALPEMGRFALDFAEGTKVWMLEGQMGMGKTTFVRALCETLGSEDNISSPTFALVNEYRDDHDQPIYHFDFYRIKSEEEARDIGVEEYFYSGDLCLVEWPGLIPSFWPDEYMVIRITPGSDRDLRTFSFERYGER